MNKLLVLGLFAFCCLSVSAQPKETPTTNPNYDAALAKKLGGNDGGMRSYVLAILKTGPNDASITDKDERSKLFAGHMSNIGRLADEGKIAVAGPFGKNDKSFRGLYIFAVSTVEAAQALAVSDPAIKAGIFVVDYIPWFGSASLMATPEIHKKISKNPN